MNDFEQLWAAVTRKGPREPFLKTVWLRRGTTTVRYQYQRAALPREQHPGGPRFLPIRTGDWRDFPLLVRALNGCQALKRLRHLNLYAKGAMILCDARL